MSLKSVLDEKSFCKLKATLDDLVCQKNTAQGLLSAPDPLQIATIHKDEFVCLLCALFAYGNAKNIVKFLQSLDFSLLDESELSIKKRVERAKFKYRFQSNADIAQIFITLRRLKQENTLEKLFLQGYEKDKNIMSALRGFIRKVRSINAYSSLGYDFFFGAPFASEPKGAMKRYNMLLRWCVRADELDLGLWKGIDKAHLLVPLDTHTHKVALKLGLMSRKSYDFKAVLELTEVLREFDAQDPIKYDFALYRLGQSKDYLSLKDYLNLKND